MKKTKKAFPAGTFIATPARIMAILQLCLAFTVLLWNLSQPFMGDHFAIKSKMLLHEYVLGKEAFSTLPIDKQQAVINSYIHLEKQLGTSFWEKLKKSFTRTAFEIPPFERGWLLLSFIIPILLLKKVDGAVKAVWLLPILTSFYCADNWKTGAMPSLTEEEKLFPTENHLVVNYLHEPLSKNIFKQQEQLKNAWEKYLIDIWAKENPSVQAEEFARQLEKGDFAFNLSRVEALHREKRMPVYAKESIVVLAIYVLWNFLFALIATYYRPKGQSNHLLSPHPHIQR